MKGSPACNVLRSQEISFLEHACAGVLVIDPNDVMGGKSEHLIKWREHV